MAFLKPKQERTPEENSRIKETLKLISGETPEQKNVLPKSVCDFIALVTEYREAEKEYKKIRQRGSIRVSERLAIMEQTTAIGEKLDKALKNILPLKTEPDGNCD